MLSRKTRDDNVDLSIYQVQKKPKKKNNRKKAASKTKR